MINKRYATYIITHKVRNERKYLIIWLEMVELTTPLHHNHSRDLTALLQL